MEPITIAMTTLPHGHGLPLPAYQTPSAAGMDLLAAVSAPLELPPMARAVAPCGFCMALPEGFEAQIRPRSGLALKAGLTVLNSPGTIDADYRGEIMVILVNLGQQPFTMTRGMRIAQMVIAPVTRGVWSTVNSAAELPTSQRGEGGFGSTGTHHG